MRRERTHSLQYFNVAFTCEKGNGTSQNMRHDDVEQKNRGEGKHSSSEKNPKATDYNGHR